jgi:hypothetical protein
MATATTPTRKRFAADLCTALGIASAATTTKRQNASDKIFGVWTDFWAGEGKPSTLHTLLPEDILCYLLVFGLRYRKGGQKGKPVRSGTVCDAITAVAKGFTDLDCPDPRVNLKTGKLNSVLTDFYGSMERDDDPASSAYPVNITIIQELFLVLDVTQSWATSSSKPSSSSSLPSSGYSALENTSTPPQLNPAAKPFVSAMSPSRYMTKSLPPSRHLCMTRTGRPSPKANSSPPFEVPASRSLTKRMLSKASKWANAPH